MRSLILLGKLKTTILFLAVGGLIASATLVVQPPATELTALSTPKHTTALFVTGALEPVQAKVESNSQAPSTPVLSEFPRIETRCVELVRKVQPAVVGVLCPSKASLPRSKRHTGGGSGVIITADGLVLSQMHVSHLRLNAKDFSDFHKPGEEAAILLADGTERKAKLLGADRDYDLSLLQLSEPGPYPFVPLQNDVKVRTGDWVVKIGHPLGFRKDRPAPVRLGRVLGSVPEAFVTDCPIVRGDSGGPFFDLEGRLVGIINQGDAGVALYFFGKPTDSENVFEPGVLEVLYAAVATTRIAKVMDAMKKGEIIPEAGRAHIQALVNAERLPADQWTQGTQIKGYFETITTPLRTSVVTILNGGVPIALGTVVDNDGSAVVKASHLPLRPQCRLPDGTTVAVTVIGVDKSFDLAVIRIPSKSIRPVLWRDRGPSPVGTIMAAVGPDGLPLVVGVVSVVSRKLADAKVPSYDLPLRMKVDAPEVWAVPAKDGNGYTVKSTSGLARIVGIKPGDRLESIAGRPIKVQEDIAKSVSEKLSGDVVPVVIARSGKTMTVELPLLPEVLSIATWRSDDFPTALEYSPPVNSTDCGGPLVDLSGRVIGITVGRSNGHAGWAIPADEVKRIVAYAKEGKLTAWPAP